MTKGEQGHIFDPSTPSVGLAMRSMFINTRTVELHLVCSLLPYNIYNLARAFQFFGKYIELTTLVRDLY